MEALLVGTLTAITAMVGVATFQLRVSPDTVLQAWSDPASVHDGWFEHHPGALRALRLLSASMLVLFAFLTGLTLTFLLGT